MTTDNSDSTYDESPEAGRQVPGPISDTMVLGRRVSLVTLLFTLLFTLILAGVFFSGQAGFLLYVLIPVFLLNLWICVVLFFRRPRAVIERGTFWIQFIPKWSTPATNVANIELRSAKMTVTFDSVESVEPPQRRSALSACFQENGYHLLSGSGVFSLDQVNQLRHALGMLPQHRDAFAGFEATLDHLTPQVIVTPAIIAANIIVFGAMVLSGGGLLMPETLFMIDWGANFAGLTLNGQWWRLLTCVFLHFGIIHMLVNMWVLRDIGRVVERLVGNTGFALGYLISGFAGSVASVLWNEFKVSAGASGAVFGVFGMLLGFMALHKQSVPAEVVKDHRGTAIAFIVFNVVIGFSIPWIDQAAHLGGFLAGCCCGLVLGCDLESAAVQRKYRNLILGLFAAIAIPLVVTSLPVREPNLSFVEEVIRDIDADAAVVYQEVFDGIQSGQVTPAEAARQIERRILPSYAELSEWIDIFPGEGRSAWKERGLANYIQARHQGWVLLAKAYSQDSIILRGRAILKFEEARDVMARIRPSGKRERAEPADWQSELAVFCVTEAASLKTYEYLLGRFGRGAFTEQELADSIEREVLSIWQEGKSRFETATQQSPALDQPSIRLVKEYLTLKAEAWELQIEAMREGSESKSRESIAKFEAAKIASEAIGKARSGR